MLDRKSFITDGQDIIIISLSSEHYAHTGPPVWDVVMLQGYLSDYMRAGTRHLLRRPIIEQGEELGARTAYYTLCATWTRSGFKCYETTDPTVTLGHLRAHHTLLQHSQLTAENPEPPEPEQPEAPAPELDTWDMLEL